MHLKHIESFTFTLYDIPCFLIIRLVMADYVVFILFQSIQNQYSTVSPNKEDDIGLPKVAFYGTELSKFQVGTSASLARAFLRRHFPHFSSTVLQGEIHNGRIEDTNFIPISSHTGQNTLQQLPLPSIALFFFLFAQRGTALLFYSPFTNFS